MPPSDKAETYSRHSFAIALLAVVTRSLTVTSQRSGRHPKSASADLDIYDRKAGRVALYPPGSTVWREVRKAHAVRSRDGCRANRAPASWSAVV